MICPNCKKELPDDSKFCQYCGNTVSHRKPSAKTTVAKKSSKPILVIVITIAALIGILAAAYWGTYSLAKNAALHGNFTKASELLVVPSVTSIHDPLLPSYVSAGILYENGNYAEAKAIFEALAEANYLAAEEMSAESDYQIARKLSETGMYSEARKAFSPLADADYKDSSEMMKTAAFYEALTALEEKDYSNYLSSYNTISALAQEGFPLAVEKIDAAKELVYDYAVRKYHDGAVFTAYSVFEVIPEYQRSSDYMILCQGDDCKALIKLIDFENAKDVIFDRMPVEFLNGSWVTEDGKYFFNIDKTYYITFNFPSEKDTKNYGFSNGIFFSFMDYGIPNFDSYMYLRQKTGMFDEDQSTGISIIDRNPDFYKLLHFQIKDENTVFVYCYANGNTYRMYRQ